MGNQAEMTDVELAIKDAIDDKLDEINDFVLAHEHGDNMHFIMNFYVNLSAQMMAQVYRASEDPGKVQDAFNSIVNMNSQHLMYDGNTQ